jgi:hypothetical protein
MVERNMMIFLDATYENAIIRSYIYMPVPSDQMRISKKDKNKIRDIELMRKADLSRIMIRRQRCSKRGGRASPQSRRQR